jgi:hypothetical protein
MITLSKHTFAPKKRKTIEYDGRGPTPKFVQESARLLGTENVAAAVAVKAYFDLSKSQTSTPSILQRKNGLGKA